MGPEISTQYWRPYRSASTQPRNLLQSRQGFAHAKRKRYARARARSLNPARISLAVKFGIVFHHLYPLDVQRAGAALFAKRKQKSEKWIVDENTVKQKTAAAAAAANMPAAPAPVPETAPVQSVPLQSRSEQTQKIASVQVDKGFFLNDRFEI